VKQLDSVVTDLRGLLLEYPYLDLCFITQEGVKLKLSECYFEYSEDESEAKIVVELKV